MNFWKIYIRYLLFGLIVNGALSTTNWRQIIIIILIGIPVSLLFDKYQVPEKINNVLKDHP